MRSHVSERVNCTVPGYEEVIGESSNLPECTDNQTAAYSTNQLYYSMAETASNATAG
jgi:hypothetical protein